MCDPITLIAGIGSALGAGASLLKKTPKPPPMPAIAAPIANDTNADVRAPDDDVTQSSAPDFVGFTEQRKAGSSVGGLGRSGLAL